MAKRQLIIIPEEAQQPIDPFYFSFGDQSIKISVSYTPDDSALIKTTQQITEELRRVTAEDKALNGPVYPLDSLHAQGVLSPTCNLCSVVATLRWVLGIEVDGSGPRRTANINQEELERAQRRTRRYERSRQPEAIVNDW